MNRRDLLTGGAALLAGPALAQTAHQHGPTLRPMAPSPGRFHNLFQSGAPTTSPLRPCDSNSLYRGIIDGGRMPVVVALMFRMRSLLLLFLMILAGPVKAADPVLAPSGTLRAAYIGPNVAQARLDPATGAISGMIADIARELGRRADVPVSITPLPTAAAVLDAVRSGQADIGFVAPNPERAGIVLYSQTYMLVQQSALVRADSPLRSVEELNRPGQVIGVNTDDSVGVWLKHRLTGAKVRETPDYTLRDAARWLQNGEVVAFAGGRQRLFSGTRNVPGLRMLDDNFYGVPQAVAVPLDRPDRLRLVNATLAEMRSSGFLAGSIARSGIEGLAVAPAETQEP